MEAIAVVSYATSVWLLAKNRPAVSGGGLVGSSPMVFYGGRLFAVVGIQLFYFVTSLGDLDLASRRLERLRFSELTATPTLA